MSTYRMPVLIEYDDDEKGYFFKEGIGE